MFQRQRHVRSLYNAHINVSDGELSEINLHIRFAVSTVASLQMEYFEEKCVKVALGYGLCNGHEIQN